MTEESGSFKDSRAKKVEGRAKRRRFVQGTRAFTHALTNSIARRSRSKQKPREDESEPKP